MRGSPRVRGVVTDDQLAERFAEHRPRLRSVAQRMLGSSADADDALQDAWIRVSRAGTDGVDNLDGWLTTVVARTCLNMLRARGNRREDPWDARVPDLVVTGPEEEVVLADAVGLALLVVLETLTPAERLAFVLHDLFAVPFEEIAPMLDRTPEATRQLASRARRRARGATPGEDVDPARQRAVVDAFFAAARGGDLERLVALLHPDVVLVSDGGRARPELNVVVRGARAVAGRALLFAGPAEILRPVLVNGAAGVVVAPEGLAVTIIAFTTHADRVLTVHALSDPDRLAMLGLAAVTSRR